MVLKVLIQVRYYLIHDLHKKNFLQESRWGEEPFQPNDARAFAVLTPERSAAISQKHLVQLSVVCCAPSP